MSYYTLQIKLENQKPIISIFKVENDIGYVWCCGIKFRIENRYNSEDIEFEAYRYQQYSIFNELISVQNLIDTSQFSLNRFDTDLVIDTLAAKLAESLETVCN